MARRFRFSSVALRQAALVVRGVWLGTAEVQSGEERQSSKQASNTRARERAIDR